MNHFTNCLRLKRVNNKLIKNIPHRGTVGNGSELPPLSRQDLIDRGILVSADEIAVGLTTRRRPRRAWQWMHTAHKDDLSPPYVGEDVRGCGYCMAGALHSFDLHEFRLWSNGCSHEQAA